MSRITPDGTQRKDSVEDLAIVITENDLQEVADWTDNLRASIASLQDSEAGGIEEARFEQEMAEGFNKIVSLAVKVATGRANKVPQPEQVETFRSMIFDRMKASGGLTGILSQALGTFT